MTSALTAAPAAESQERFEKAFSGIRSCLQTERARKLSELLWNHFTEAECKAASKWFEDMNEVLEAFSYLDGTYDSLAEDSVFPLDELRTALYLCNYCRLEEMSPERITAAD